MRATLRVGAAILSGGIGVAPPARLSAVDHRARDRRKVRPYLRYMDDMLLFDDDASRLADHAASLEDACTRLRLRLHRRAPKPKPSPPPMQARSCAKELSLPAAINSPAIATTNVLPW